MHAAFVWWCRARSDYRRRDSNRCLRGSHTVWRCLRSLSLGLSLASGCREGPRFTCGAACTYPSAKQSYGGRRVSAGRRHAAATPYRGFLGVVPQLVVSAEERQLRKELARGGVSLNAVAAARSASLPWLYLRAGAGIPSSSLLCQRVRTAGMRRPGWWMPSRPKSSRRAVHRPDAPASGPLQPRCA